MNTVQKSIDIAGVTVIVRELTVAEIRAALKMEEFSGETPSSSDAVDLFLFEDISLPDICRMTDISPEQLTDMTPSQLRKIMEACKEVNPDFFALRGRVLQYVDLIAQENRPENSLK